jgi:glycosyltransferase involved in cell wall biosynthesis
MASGCPVLVSDIPGNREWIKPGVQGWLFKDGDPNELERSLYRALDEKRDRLLEMGKAARMLVEHRADWTKNFPKLFEAYRLALESSGIHSS